jgi:hypothetical protein
MTTFIDWLALALVLAGLVLALVANPFLGAISFAIGIFVAFHPRSRHHA